MSNKHGSRPPDRDRKPGLTSREKQDAAVAVGFAPGWPRIAGDDEPADSDSSVGFAPGWPRWVRG